MKPWHNKSLHLLSLKTAMETKKKAFLLLLINAFVLILLCALALLGATKSGPCNPGIGLLIWVASGLLMLGNLLRLLIICIIRPKELAPLNRILIQIVALVLVFLIGLIPS
jgi:hypothetical protein